MELLDKFSHHVRVTKIDQKYKEQYLDTIKQLVQERFSLNSSYDVVIFHQIVRLWAPVKRLF